MEWCACILLYTEKTTVAVDPLRLQSIYCTHISVWACLACVPDAEARGSIEERRGCPDALGARGRPFLLRAVPWVSLRAILVSALSIKSHAARPRRARHFWQVVRT